MKKRVKNPVEKKKTISRAAMTLFVAKGFHAVTMPEIVQASGVSTGAIYHHFGSKVNLARHTLDDAVEEFHERLMHQVTGKVSAHDKIRAFSELVFELSHTDPVLAEFLFLVNHREFQGDVKPLWVSKPIRYLQAVLEEGMAQGEVSSSNSMVKVAALIGVLAKNLELERSGVLDQSNRSQHLRIVVDSAWAVAA